MTDCGMRETHREGILRNRTEITTLCSILIISKALVGTGART